MTPRLFFFSDGVRGSGDRPLTEVIPELVAGGVDAVVLREFQLSSAGWLELVDALQPIRSAGARLLVSRRLDIARAGGVDGAHLAADSLGLREAREFLGPTALLGYSAHDRAEAERAAAAGANYVSLSPIYPTESKPGAAGQGLAWLAAASQGLEIPVLGLGGVTPERTEGILRSGAWGVAAVSALGAAKDVRRAASAFRTVIEETIPTCV